MADRYWVGGSGNWSDSTNHWASGSGASPGGSKPASTDNAIFDSLSSAGNYFVGMDETGNMLDLTFGAPATGVITLSGSGGLSPRGSVSFHSGMIDSWTGTLTMAATTTGKTITTNSFSLNALTFSGVGGEWTLQDDLICTGSLTLTSGIFNTNSKQVTIPQFSSNNTNTRTFAINNSTIILNSSAVATIWFISSTGLTFTTSGSSIITLDATDANYTFQGAGLTYDRLNISGSAGTVQLSGSNTFNTLAVTSPNKTVKFVDGFTNTVSNFIATQTSTKLSGSGTTGWTISDASGSNVVQNCTIQYSTATGGATWDATNISNVDAGNNTGWDFGNSPKINIGNAWKNIIGFQTNFDGNWKNVSAAKINIGNAWKTIF